ITLLVTVGINLSCFAQTQAMYTFPNQTAQQQFVRLTTELRCLVCQNENLADSNAKLAADLRTQIHQMILAGKTDNEIKTYMVKRYGDFILYKPVFNVTTSLLWLAPLILILLGLIPLIFVMRKSR
ncbi:MAG: cytochrome c-type biogenesis protein, partial [Pseudomonadota bacterium]